MSTTLSKQSSLLLSTIFLVACGTAAAPPPASTSGALSTPVPAAAGEVAFESLEVARASQVATLVMASPRATTGELDALSKHLRLPVMLGQEAYGRMAAASPGGAKVAELTNKLDAMTPIALVWLMDKQIKGIGYCGAMTVAEGVEAKGLLGEFGQEKSFEAGISERVDAYGVTLFVAAKGRTLLVANNRQSLQKGGALAMASQVRRGDEQIAVTIWPQALATGSGRSYEQLAKRVDTMLETLPTPTGGQVTVAGRRMMRAAVDTLFSYLTQTETIRFVFVATSQAGLVLRTELSPRPNTALGLLAAKTAPFSFDRGLPTKHDGVSLFAWGDIWNGLSDVQKIFQASGPKGEKLAETWRKLHGEQVSGGSCSLDFTSPAWLLVCSYDLRKGVDANQALDSFVTAYQTQNEHAAELENRKATPLKVKKGKGTVSIEQKVETADKRALAMLKTVLGTDVLKVTLTAANGKVLHSIAAKPVDPVSVYGKTPGNLPPILASTLSLATGAELMMTLEPVSPLLYLLPKVAGNEIAPILGMLSALPGGKDMHVPLLFTVRGGSALAGEIRFPIAGLESLAKVLGGLLGQPGR